MGDHQHMTMAGPGLFGPVTAILAVAAYAAAVLRDRRRRSWPGWRVLSWTVGVVVATVTVTGPMAHRDFVGHVASHLLLGMVAPVFLVLAKPVTLLVRVLPPRTGRRWVAVFRSLPVRLVTEPAVAAVLDVGGLWLIHTIDLYRAMHHGGLPATLLQVHMLLAGYLFTAVVLQVDLTPNRRSHAHRAVVLVLALAAHDVLAKHLYASPPPGVTAAQGRPGAMLMYYGGDAVDVLLIGLLCAQWFRRTRPRGHPAEVRMQPLPGV